MRKHPHLLEVSAFTLLHWRSRQKKIKNLLSIPDEEWKAIRSQGFDLLWLMGVWKRSPGARLKALHNEELKHAYHRIVPDWKESDVTGSPYAIYDYSLDPYLGDSKDLGQVRKKINDSGLKLILDFVPNHLALDHPWTQSFPQYFVTVPKEVAEKHPHIFYRSHSHYFAHGKDPHFHPWEDTVQINFFSAELRQAFAAELLKIAAVADGVRCDMAMLALNPIFEKTWGSYLKGSDPFRAYRGLTPLAQKEFWAEIIPQVKKKFPSFLFIAEAYWDLEWQLQQLGFDFTYDKRLYDRLLHATPHDIKGHLKADLLYQEHSVRFIENHDEKRAVSAFGREKSQAAAVVMSTVPGLRFFHEGQMEGKKTHQPIQLNREPFDEKDPHIQRFYSALLDFCNSKTLHEGNWEWIETSHHHLLTWAWKSKEEMAWIIVNYSSAHARGRVPFSCHGIRSQAITLRDALTNLEYVREVHEIRHHGLLVALDPWQSHLFEVKRQP